MITQIYQQRREDRISLCRRFAAVSMAAILLFSAGSPAIADWPVQRGNAKGTGVSDSPMPKEIALIWKYEIPKGAFEATPIIADGTVFIGDLDGHVLALDLKTGEEKWKIKYDAGFIASPGFADGRVFLGDYDGLFRALDAKTGKELWKFETQGEIDSGSAFYESSVLVASQDGSLYRLNQADGELVWKYETGDQLRCSPTIVGNRTFLGGCDGKLHIVDLDKGESISTDLPLGSPTGSTPAAIGDMAIVGTYGGAIFGFDWKTVTQKWMFQDTEISPEIRASVSATDTLAVTNSRSRRVFAVKVDSGKLAWQVTLNKRADSSPTISADGRVWIAATDGRLYALDLETGKESWTYEIQGGFLGGPAIADSKLVVASDKGTVFCFGSPQ